MSVIINNQAERLEYNNIKVQCFPLTQKYNVQSLHVFINIEGITFNERCLIYREFIVEQYDAMLDDYFDHLEASYIFEKQKIIITFNQKLSVDTYINLIEMLKDLFDTVEEVKITYEKSILNIHNEVLP